MKGNTMIGHRMSLVPLAAILLVSAAVRIAVVAEADKRQEQLLNPRKDPGKTRHFIDDPEHAELLQGLRTAFDNYWFP
jgi:hypothetical protein